MLLDADALCLNGARSDKFGWPVSKADELLLPVLREYDNRQAQLRMEQFLSFSQRFAKIRSKRMQVGTRCTSNDLHTPFAVGQPLRPICPE